MATLKNTSINDTGFFKLPVGTSAERPSTPTTGSMRYNTTTSALEIHLSGRWQKVSLSDYVVSSIEYLVIAGGGGGGISGGGGGGAGGYRTSVSGQTSGGGASAESSQTIAINSNIVLTVGAGGSGETSGNNSVFNTITSIGGGRAGSHPDPFSNGSSGGSGGGAARNYFDYTFTGGTGTTLQGFAGGASTTGDYNRTAGGGGGAGSVASKNGGIGLPNNITGQSTSRAGGGGAGDATYDRPGGGAGSATDGGGAGGFRAAGSNGTQNTGGGGGGGSFTTVNFAAGLGGSGVVIIRYPNTFGNLIIGSGLTYRDSSGNNQSGGGVAVAPSFTPTGYKVYQFNAGTGNIQFQL